MALHIQGTVVPGYEPDFENRFFATIFTLEQLGIYIFNLAFIDSSLYFSLLRPTSIIPDVY